ncbi:hypothetical protein MtrunA17_Chr7g0246811 [Medicago truncatula]|uniref:Polynucleotidyl transferase, Ribonuclease H fold n=1 Tax=Medicago truncatula TaxID=3880 RepID=A2Q3P7_MEDTR|nr:Polynucleotidyl transferase, Ribonuclease H fold [Medicago truncatula]RHN46867.1 hypothetical protein MtrunA17_Chr7g0246811 [Medicago truncatula]
MALQFTLSRLLAHLSPTQEETLKLNVDGCFPEDSKCLGVGGVICKHYDDWVADFSHCKIGGDVLQAKLCVIHMSLDFYHNKSRNNIVYESGCLKVVELFIVSLRSYISHLRIRYLV